MVFSCCGVSFCQSSEWCHFAKRSLVMLCVLFYGVFMLWCVLLPKQRVVSCRVVHPAAAQPAAGWLSLWRRMNQRRNCSKPTTPRHSGAHFWTQPMCTLQLAGQGRARVEPFPPADRLKLPSPPRGTWGKQGSQHSSRSGRARTAAASSSCCVYINTPNPELGSGRCFLPPGCAANNTP